MSDIIVIPCGRHVGKSLPEVLNIDEPYSIVLMKHVFFAETEEQWIAAVRATEAELLISH